ncbi:tetratricopeptide repeat protein [Numidum massiliense]|uniref:tetratricopeptide repeat protein n=1 Tax=Numidum massiliense TaxID=1522315 RepID=UPI0006D537D4|nr:hypothetical protein [Numidum massiliense]
MMHEWFDWAEATLTQIEQVWTYCPDEVKREIASRFQALREMSDAWLDEWLLLQERLDELAMKYPGLNGAWENGGGGETTYDPQLPSSLLELLLGENTPGGDGVNLASGASNPNSEDPANEDPANGVGNAKKSDGVDSEDDVLEFWIDEHALRQFREGQGYYNLWMLPEAMQHFNEVVAVEPDFILGRLYLALTYYERRELDEAERQLRLVLETAPHDEFRRIANHMLGCVAVKRGRDPEAVRHFSAALQFDDSDSDTLFNLGACHIRLRAVRLAIPFFEQVILQRNDDWESMLYLARAFAALGQAELAAYWRRVAYEASQKPHIATEIADSYEQQGQLDVACAWNMYCVRKHPEWAEGYHGVAWILWKRDRDPRAIVWLKKALALKRDDVNILFSYWWIVQAEGTAREKQRVEQFLASRLEEYHLWQLARGNQYRLSGDAEQARSALTPLLNAKALGMQGAAHYQLAHLYMAEQKWLKAVQHFHAARDRDVYLNDTWLFEGICHYLAGDIDTSRRCLQLYQTQASGEV